MYFWIQTKQSCEFSLLVCSQRYKHFLERVVLYLLRASIVLTSNQKRICHPFLGRQSPQAEKACLHNSMPPDWLHPFQQSSPSSQFLYFHTPKMMDLTSNNDTSLYSTNNIGLCDPGFIFDCSLITYIRQDGPCTIKCIKLIQVRHTSIISTSTKNKQARFD